MGPEGSNGGVSKEFEIALTTPPYLIPVGTVTLSNEESAVNASVPMEVMALGKLTQVKAEYIKALCPMVVTLVGMVMKVKAENIKALSPIVVTLAGMVMEVKAVL